MIFCLNNVFSQEKALFIGNSMTYFNNMPNLFQELANSKGKNVQDDHRYILMIFWDHIEDHTEGFRKSAAYQE